MMELKELIKYWKDRQQPHPPITPIPWESVLTSTIKYLEELQGTKEKDE